MSLEREGVRVFVGEQAPAAPREGDIWLQVKPPQGWWAVLPLVVWLRSRHTMRAVRIRDFLGA